jgi:hypothetical protein
MKDAINEAAPDKIKSLVVSEVFSFLLQNISLQLMYKLAILFDIDYICLPFVF